MFFKTLNSRLWWLRTVKPAWFTNVGDPAHSQLVHLQVRASTLWLAALSPGRGAQATEAFRFGVWHDWATSPLLHFTSNSRQGRKINYEYRKQQKELLVPQLTALRSFVTHLETIERSSMIGEAEAITKARIVAGH